MDKEMLQREIETLKKELTRVLRELGRLGETRTKLIAAIKEKRKELEPSLFDERTEQ